MGTVRYRWSKMSLHRGQKDVTSFYLKDKHKLACGGGAGGGGGCKGRLAKAVGVSFARDVAASSVAVVAAIVVVCHRRRRVLSRTMMMALRKKFRTNRFLDLVP